MNSNVVKPDVAYTEHVSKVFVDSSNLVFQNPYENKSVKQSFMN